MISHMIIAIMKIFPRKEKHLEALDVMLSVKGPVLVEPGCLCCCLYNEHGDEPGLLYIEQWQSLPELEQHIKNNSYIRILEVMELSSRPPEISFHETGKKWGFELIEKVRTSSYQNKQEDIA